MRRSKNSSASDPRTSSPSRASRSFSRSASTFYRCQRLSPCKIKEKKRKRKKEKKKKREKEKKKKRKKEKKRKREKEKKRKREKERREKREKKKREKTTFDFS
jgi:hypothetical protein